jgi:hypothetical protein
MMKPGQHRPTEGELAALADGSLPARRRARVEQAVASSPHMQAELAAERLARRAIRGAVAERAPAALRARLELARDPDPRWRLPRFTTAIVATAAVAAFAAALVLTIGGGATGTPTVAAAATLGSRQPVSVATETPNDHGVLPGVTGAGISFPDWGTSFGFDAIGVRRDHLGDRFATTVYYARGDQRVAYTIMSGPPLPAGAAVHESVWQGTRLGSFLARGRVVVTWLRNGHTCVLSGPDTPPTVLATLAAWKSGHPGGPAAAHVYSG